MVQKKALLWAYGCILILVQCQNLSQDKRSIEELSAAIRLDPSTLSNGQEMFFSA